MNAYPTLDGRYAYPTLYVLYCFPTSDVHYAYPILNLHCYPTLHDFLITIWSN